MRSETEGRTDRLQSKQQCKRKTPTHSHIEIYICRPTQVQSSHLNKSGKVKDEVDTNHVAVASSDKQTEVSGFNSTGASGRCSDREKVKISNPNFLSVLHHFAFTNDQHVY